VADVQLYLKDGQVLEGSDVWRQGGNYHLQLAGGGIVPIPEQLVDRVGLSAQREEPPEEEADDWPPTGLTESGPQQLAGERVVPTTPREQTEVLGEPSRFQPGVFDPYWHPESDWPGDPGDPGRNDFAPSEWAESIVDPDWKPENAYPEDQTEFSPADWKDSIVDPGWAPQDGFKKRQPTSFSLSSAGRTMTAATTRLAGGRSLPAADTEDGRFSFAASYTEGRAISGACHLCPDTSKPVQASLRRGATKSAPRAEPGSDPDSCAERLLAAYFESSAPGSEETASAVRRSTVEPVGERPLIDLPIALHRALWELEDEILTLTYSIDTGTCRPINGDLDRLLGIELSDDQRLELATSAYNSVLAESSVELVTDQQKIDYAFAVTALLDPTLAGGDAGEVILLRAAEDLERLREVPDGEDSRGQKRRKKKMKTVSKRFSPPAVAAGSEGDVVTFCTWSEKAGDVGRYEVRLTEAGAVRVKREPLASGLGAHEPPARQG
jgi:hypothetical protein